MSDIIARGPGVVTRSRLFEYMLYFCRQTEHRLDELDPAASRGDVGKEIYPEDADHMAYNKLSPREILEHDQLIEHDLQWCVQHRLIVEVTDLGPCYLC